ncbi:MAG TPA: hypothetical protein VN616_13405 [Puia sp.]|nr:hypothetical protein [Puia sp.]
MIKTLFLLLLCSAGGACLQTGDPWTPAELVEPADLASMIRHPPANPPLLICVGPSGLIKGSVDAGPAHEEPNLARLRQLLGKEDRNREVIIYCGCCPFSHCPNIRPAFSVLKELHFTHPRLLDLAHNIRVDWINPGYPVQEGK